MYRKTLLFIILLGTFAYFLIVINAKTSREIRADSPISINKNTAKVSISTLQDKQFIQPILTQEISCSKLEQANKTDKFNKANFISTKAIQWYFEGYDKNNIAEALAVTFDYSIAMKWIESINSFSRYHAKHTELIQSIDTLDYASNFSKKSLHLQNLSRYQLLIDNEKFDLEQLFNQYPDVAVRHWSAALHHALQNNNVDSAINAINELKAYVKNSVFFQHPMKNAMILYPLSSFTEQEAEEIITALFDLSPVYVGKTNRYDNMHKQMLSGLGIDESLWKFALINPDSFKVAPSINKLIEQVKVEYIALDEHPAAENLCREQSINTELAKIKVIKVSANKSKHSLSPAWQGVHKMLCPEKNFFNGMIAVKKRLNNFDIAWQDLDSYEGLQKNITKLKIALKQFDEYQRASLFNRIYMNVRLEYDQIDELINNNITPADSDFYFLIRQLPLDQQKELLLEHQYDLANFNSIDVSLITNALMYGRGNNSDELVPFLITQGFPLKLNESSPDPLWMQLYLLSFESIKKELPKRTISNLIEHTKLNEIHIDIMYKIKQKNIKLYKMLIEEFPKLKFEEPKTIAEISCGFGVGLR